MDKKKYLVPEEEIIELKYNGVLCASDGDGGGTPEEGEDF